MFWTALRRLVVVVAVVAASYGAYWYYGTTLVRVGVENWIVAARADGIDAAHGGLEISGFPLAYRVDIDRPALAGAGAGAIWEWTSERATAEFGPFDFQKFRLRVEGEQSLLVANRGDQPMAFRSPGPTDVAVVIAGDRMPRELTIRARDLTATQPPDIVGTRLVRLDLDATRRIAGARPGRPEGIDIALSIERIILPAAVEGLLGREVERITADLDVIGTAPQGPPRIPPRIAAAAWRDQGGKLKIRKLFVKWGGFNITARGTLVLDDALQPAGKLIVEIVGHREVLRALVAKGLMRAKDSVGVRSVLDLLAKRPADGGPPVITAPLVIRKARVMLGPIALMKLPRLVWPE